MLNESKFLQNLKFDPSDPAPLPEKVPLELFWLDFQLLHDNLLVGL